MDVGAVVSGFKRVFGALDEKVPFAAVENWMAAKLDGRQYAVSIPFGGVTTVGFDDDMLIIASYSATAFPDEDTDTKN